MASAAARTKVGRYRKVAVKVHDDERVRALSRPGPNGYTLFLYLLTSPFSTAIPGLSRCGVAQIAEHLGWSVAGTRRCLAEICDAGLAQYDPVALVLWMPRGIRYHQPESPNVVTGWAKAWLEIPTCELAMAALATLRSEVDTRGEGFPKAFREAFPEAFAEPFEKAFPEAFSKGLANQDTGDSRYPPIIPPSEPSAKPSRRRARGGEGQSSIPPPPVSPAEALDQALLAAEHGALPELVEQGVLDANEAASLLERMRGEAADAAAVERALAVAQEWRLLLPVAAPAAVALARELTVPLQRRVLQRAEKLGFLAQLDDLLEACRLHWVEQKGKRDWYRCATNWLDKQAEFRAERQARAGTPANGNGQHAPAPASPAEQAQADAEARERAQRLIAAKRALDRIHCAENLLPRNPKRAAAIAALREQWDDYGWTWPPTELDRARLEVLCTNLRLPHYVEPAPLPTERDVVPTPIAALVDQPALDLAPAAPATPSPGAQAPAVAS